MRISGKGPLVLAGLVATLGLAGLSLVSATSASAAPKGKDDDSSSSSSTSDKKPGNANANKRISAYDQAIIDANKVFQAGVAGNMLDDAIAGYRKAISIDPARPEGHLFLGAGLYAKGDYAGAETALADAANRAHADSKEYANVLGKALFLTATTKDAQGKTDESKTAWAAYADFAKANPDQDYPKGSGDAPPMLVKVFPATALDRDVKVSAYAKAKVDYANVRDLIEKRQKELGVGTPEPKKP